MCGALATKPPAASKSAHEKSSRSLMFADMLRTQREHVATEPRHAQPKRCPLMFGGNRPFENRPSVRR
jgi:hypothetical protein